VLREVLRSGAHNGPLNSFLARASAAVREEFHGPVTYASLPVEHVDWEMFDLIGINHYWTVQERDEDLQARSLVRQLELLDTAGVDGAFVYTFTAPLWTHGDDPEHDLDTDSYSLVKPCPGHRHGTTYPDMAWGPKKSFTAVAEYYRA
jgi:hypothetical protein